MTDPFRSMPTRKMTRIEVIQAIRQDIMAELDAIHLYEAHISAIDDPVVRRVLEHVRDEEKEHVGEFLALLKRLDPGQAQALESGYEEIREILEGGGEGGGEGERGGGEARGGG